MTESMRKKEESKLLNDIIRELYPLAVMERVNCGVARWPDGRPCRLAPTGHSDLRGVLRADKSKYGVAVPIYIEANYGDGEATKEQIAKLCRVGTALHIENDGGITTAFAIGTKPEEDLALQVILTEVVSA